MGLTRSPPPKICQSPFALLNVVDANPNNTQRLSSLVEIPEPDSTITLKDIFFTLAFVYYIAHISIYNKYHNISTLSSRVLIYITACFYLLIYYYFWIAAIGKAMRAGSITCFLMKYFVRGD